jgi:ABC-type transport system substrate-binding protein/PKD repeat protein
MSDMRFGTTKTTILSAVFFVLLMLGVPSFFTPGQQFETTAVASASEDVVRSFTIGVADLGVSTLNPNTYTMVAEGLLIFPCYSTLLQYTVDMEVIGDLAEKWSYSPDGLEWYFKIVDNAYFCDPAAPTDTSHQVTAADVEFSFMSLQNDDGSRLHTYFPGIIESFDIINDYEFTITLNGPFATIMESWLGAMILPQYYWAGEDFTNFDNTPPIGSGAFYYATEGMPESGQAELARNPIWYGTENHGWQIHTDKWILKEELNDDAAWLDVMSGAIDVMLGVNPSIYTTKLMESTTTDVVGFSQCNGFVYEFNLNQMSDELRASLGGQYLSGSNNQLLLDEVVKTAMSYCVNKDGFIADVLWGLGAYADSLVPAQNPGHYTYPDPDPYDPMAARWMLYQEGWQYRLDGTQIKSTDSDNQTYYPLCKVGGADPLRFSFITMDTDVQWTVGSKYIVNSTRLGGFDLQLSIESTNDMNGAWYQADYDIWLWDWVMGVTAEAVSIMEVFSTEAIGTDQDVYWTNETFDDIYHEALVTMDPAARHELSDQLQALAYEMRGCQCVAYRDELYAVNVATWAEASLGDWNNEYFLLPDVWNWWVAMQLYPNENHAPTLNSWTETISGEVGDDISFTAGATDDDSTTVLEYRWFWGDGTRSDWSTSPDTTHAYATDGFYQADVAVRESTSSKGFDDFFMVSKPVRVTVRDSSNAAPVLNDWSCEPAAPNTGTLMWFNSSATDEESDDIYYTWIFGDGHMMTGQNVRYQYTEDGSYTVELSITDNRVGVEGSRPVFDTGLVSVSKNHAPTITVSDRADVDSKQSEDFSVTASDVDPTDSLLFTWDWGDGTISVTTVTTATHTYNSKGIYTLTVYADDMTGLDGHNVSDTGLISVTSTVKNKLPVISSFVVSDSTPYTGQSVTFTAVASDPDGDPLTFTIEFGDGTFAVESFGPTADNTLETFTATKTYTAGGTYSAYFYVFDTVANVSSVRTITVTPNDAPIITGLEDEYGDTGVPMSFSATVSDEDTDPMTYYWLWGDGTGSVTADASATHTYIVTGSYGYKLFADDGCGHNTSALAVADVNAVPTLEPLSDFSVDAGTEWTFEAVALDPDLSDVLNYTWDFGDATDPAYGATVTHTYAAMESYDFSVTVTDKFELVTHTLTSTATVTVTDPLTDDPPTVTPLEDVYATVDETVTFTVEASDPEDKTLTITWDFGDSTGLFVGESVDHTYTAVNDYTFTVWVDDGANNVSDDATAYISADAPPVADAGGDRTLNEDTPTIFDGLWSSDDVNIVLYEWTIVELSETATGSTPTFEFADPGVYTVTLVVTDTIGQVSAPDTITVTVLDITDPTAVADADVTTVDMGGSVTFDGSDSTDNVDVVSWTWTFVDGVTSVTETTATFSHTFDVAGSYPVNLTVADAAGRTDTDDTITITVTDTEDPVADAGIDQSVFEGDTVTFNGTESTDNVEVVNWTWSFVYDSASELVYGETAEFVFGIAGTYPVTLTVRDAEGYTATDTMTVTVTVLPDAAPVAVVAIDSPVTVGDTVIFDGTGSSDDDVIVSWIWTFDDNGVPIELSGETQTYAFDTAGTYEITLTVTDSADQTDVAMVSVIVEAAVVTDEAPVAVAAIDSPATVGDTVTFDGTGSSDDNEIVNWTWSFDDNGVAKELWGETATYVFETVGTYEVTLTVTDDADQTDVATVSVTVEAAPALSDPPVAGAGTDQTVSIGAEVEFSGALSSDDVGVVNYTWTFTYNGSVVELYGVSPSFTFHTDGTYTVTLTVTDADGQEDTDTVTVTVNPADTTDDKTFIESYGLPIALLAIIVVAALAFMLMKRKKGGKSTTNTGLDGTTMDEPQEPSQ